MAKPLKQILNEISKDKLTSYAVKAVHDVRKQSDEKNDFLLHRNSYEQPVRAKTMDIARKFLDKHKRKVANRKAGIKKAVDKIAKD